MIPKVPVVGWLVVWSDIFVSNPTVVEVVLSCIEIVDGVLTIFSGHWDTESDIIINSMNRKSDDSSAPTSFHVLCHFEHFFPPWKTNHFYGLPHTSSMTIPPKYSLFTPSFLTPSLSSLVQSGRQMNRTRYWVRLTFWLSSFWWYMVLVSYYFYIMKL